VSSMQRVPRLYDKLKESRNLVFYDMFLRSWILRYKYIGITVTF
jgi:hypothetical protein